MAPGSFSRLREKDGHATVAQRLKVSDEIGG
jgi:hypothetical protein